MTPGRLAERVGGRYAPPVKTPRLFEVHRILITVFAVFSALFGAWSLWRSRSGDQVALACGIGSLIVAAGCVLYLRKAPYLRR